MAALGFNVRRRTPPAGPMITPGEHNQLDYSNGGGDGDVLSQILPQSLIRCRPSRRAIAFFLAPYGFQMGAEDFIMGHESIPFATRFPRGRLSIMDQRRNVAIPPRVSYGSLVGEMDGVSPNGLD